MGGVENCFFGLASFELASFELASFGLASFELASFGAKRSNCFFCGRLASFEYGLPLIKSIITTNGSRAMFDVLGKTHMIMSPATADDQCWGCIGFYIEAISPGAVKSPKTKEAISKEAIPKEANSKEASPKEARICFFLG